MNDFDNELKKWVQIEGVLSKLRAEMKAINEDKKEMEEYILKYMETKKIKSVDIPDGKLVLKTNKTQVNLKEDLIKKPLGEIIKDDVKTTEIMKYIMDKRPYVERTSLRKVKNKDK